jgi:hypothetical protein
MGCASSKSTNTSNNPTTRDIVYKRAQEIVDFSARFGDGAMEQLSTLY